MNPEGLSLAGCRVAKEIEKGPQSRSFDVSSTIWRKDWSISLVNCLGVAVGIYPFPMRGPSIDREGTLSRC